MEVLTQYNQLYIELIDHYMFALEELNTMITRLRSTDYPSTIIEEYIQYNNYMYNFAKKINELEYKIKTLFFKYNKFIALQESKEENNDRINPTIFISDIFEDNILNHFINTNYVYKYNNPLCIYDHWRALNGNDINVTKTIFDNTKKYLTNFINNLP